MFIMGKWSKCLSWGNDLNVYHGKGYKCLSWGNGLNVYGKRAECLSGERLRMNV